MIYHTCVRCGLTDANVLDLDTGGAYHPELRGCISMLRDRLATVEAERDRLLRDIQDAERYRCLRALLRHARWDYLDPISEMKPEFEKFVNDDDLDRALDAVIAVGKERAAVAAAEQEVGA